jgi:ribA/ribD-fused uncharacterized protein
MIPENANWLTKNIMVGGIIKSKDDLDELTKLGIKYFVSLIKERKKKGFYDYTTDVPSDQRRHYPIKDRYVLSDKEAIGVAKDVISLSKTGKVYLHCLGGHGRTGTIAGIILHRLNPNLGYEEILLKLAEGHSTRKYKPRKSMPETAPQLGQLYRIITGKNVIFFYHEKLQYGEFSNFYPAKIVISKPSEPELGSKEFKTSEALYQYLKFAKSGDKGRDFAEIIRMVNTPGKAAAMGRQKLLPGYKGNWPVDGRKINDVIKEYKNVEMNPLWDELKYRYMLVIVYFKFTQNPKLAKVLLDTGDAYLAEYTSRDGYWGTWWKKPGKNMLGKVLMVVRDLIRKSS